MLKHKRLFCILTRPAGRYNRNFYYLMAMVTFAWLSTPPIFTTMGIAAPAGAVRGTTTLISSTPGTEPGGPWAEFTVAASVPIVTDTPASGVMAGDAGIRAFETAEVIAPAPVTYSRTVEPLAAAPAVELTV